MHTSALTGHVIPANPAGKPVADNEATRLFGATDRVAKVTEHVLQTAHRLHERLFGPEPALAKDRQNPPPVNGMLAMTAAQLCETEDQLSRLATLLSDMEQRLGA